MSLLAEIALTKNPNCVSCDLGDDLMMHNLISGNVHILNQSARFIWNALDASKTVEDLSANLAQQFQGSEPIAANADVRETIALFNELGLLTPVVPTEQQINAHESIGD